MELNGLPCVNKVFCTFNTLSCLLLSLDISYITLTLISDYLPYHPFSHLWISPTLRLHSSRIIFLITPLISGYLLHYAYTHLRVSFLSRFNLRSGPILAVLIHSLERLPLKLGLIQTLSRWCSLRPGFGRNADWLLEQCHKI